MPMHSGVHVHDAVPELRHDSIAVRTIKIESSKVLRNPSPHKSSHERKLRIERLCSDIGPQLDEIHLLMHEAPDTDLFRQADGLKLRRSLISMMDSIEALVESQTLDGQEQSRHA